MAGVTYYQWDFSGDKYDAGDPQITNDNVQKHKNFYKSRNKVLLEDQIMKRNKRSLNYVQKTE